MIKELLERRRRKKTFQAFRKNMAEEGISTSHLTDDELEVGIKIWTANMVRVLKSTALSMTQVVEALKVMSRAVSHLNVNI